MAVKECRINAQDFFRHVAPLSGKKVSHAWLGYGETLHLDFGRLRTEVSQFRGIKRIHKKGEYRAMIEWAWRVEQRNKVLYSYFTEADKTKKFLKNLLGLKVVSLSLETPLQDLIITLENDIRIRTFKSMPTRPAWVVFLPTPNDEVSFWITQERTTLQFEMGFAPPLPQELWDAALFPPAAVAAPVRRRRKKIPLK